MRKLLLLIFLLLSGGCMETKHLRNLADNPNPQEEKLNPDDFKFSVVKARVMQKKCAGCHRSGHENPEHDNPGGVNLQTYASAKSKITYIRSVVTTGVMGFETPPALTDIEKQLIIGWIDAGAPD